MMTVSHREILAVSCEENGVQSQLACGYMNTSRADYILCTQQHIYVLAPAQIIRIRMYMQVQCVVSYERLKTMHVRACLGERLILLLSQADISFMQSCA